MISFTAELDDTARARILQHMPVAELVGMLKTANYKAAAHALSLLANNGEPLRRFLSVILNSQLDDARAQIIEENAMALLVEMLTGNKSRFGALVLQTLMKYGELLPLNIFGLLLSIQSADTRVLIIELKAIPVLVRMLKTDDCAAAAAVLTSLDGGAWIPFI